MITAVAHADDGHRIILLGVARGNIDRLTAGKPIRVSAETHPGFPTDIVFMMVFTETEGELAAMLEPYLTDQTKRVFVPQSKPGEPS